MRAKSLVVVTLLVAAGATACGSSSSSKGAAGDSTTTQSSGSTTSSGSSNAGTTTTIKLSSSGSGDFCNLAKQDQNAFNKVSPTSLTPAALKKEYEALGPALQHAEDVAPAAIKPDFTVFLDAFKPYLQALAAANFDFTKLNPASLASLSALSGPKVTAASEHIEQYFTQVCHIPVSTPTT